MVLRRSFLNFSHSQWKFNMKNALAKECGQIFNFSWSNTTITIHVLFEVLKVLRWSTICFERPFKYLKIAAFSKFMIWLKLWSLYLKWMALGDHSCFATIISRGLSKQALLNRKRMEMNMLKEKVMDYRESMWSLLTNTSIEISFQIVHKFSKRFYIIYIGDLKRDEKFSCLNGTL